jgi:hypothetical protein
VCSTSQTILAHYNQPFLMPHLLSKCSQKNRRRED